MLWAKCIGTTLQGSSCWKNIFKFNFISLHLNKVYKSPSLLILFNLLYITTIWSRFWNLWLVWTTLKHTHTGHKHSVPNRVKYSYASQSLFHVLSSVLKTVWMWLFLLPCHVNVDLFRYFITWWASSWAMTEVTSCLSIGEEWFPTSSVVSRNVISPQFSMAPARKSGMATKSIYSIKENSITTAGALFCYWWSCFANPITQLKIQERLSHPACLTGSRCQRKYCRTPTICQPCPERNAFGPSCLARHTQTPVREKKNVKKDNYTLLFSTH